MQSVVRLELRRSLLYTSNLGQGGISNKLGFPVQRPFRTEVLQLWGLLTSEPSEARDSDSCGCGSGAYPVQGSGAGLRSNLRT